MLNETTKRLIDLALAEDIGSGDMTSEILVNAEAEGQAAIIARENLIVCGQEVASAIFATVNAKLRYEILLEDGSEASCGEIIGRVRGPFRSILTAERTALNFLQRLSGIASKTRRVVNAVSGIAVNVLDTRKTLGGWRVLEKYAVKIGGGKNHRLGLFDVVLIKNNHIDALGGDVFFAVQQCRKKAPQGMRIEVEVRNQEELEAAVRAQPDAILLDNMNSEQLKEAVTYVRRQDGGAIELEASGGITESSARQFAESGVDSLSMGELTHGARSMNISLRFEPLS